MCINLKTSIGAFLIGTISSLILINSNNKENKFIGNFILFYTFIQLFEALIYNNNLTIYSRLLLINLGLQGLVFMLLLNYYITPINKIYIYICAFISIFVTFKALQPDFKKATTEGGMKWNFNIKPLFGTIFDISYILTIMYVIMIIAVVNYNNKLNNIIKLSFLLLTAYVISIYVMQFNKELVCSRNKPSIWCLSSAIVSPIMLFFKS